MSVEHALYFKYKHAFNMHVLLINERKHMLSNSARPYIQASVPVLREHGLTITEAFYENMFEEHPEFRNLFNMGNQAQGLQQQSLASAVFAYAANFEQPAALGPVVSRIAHKHASLGITAEHYPIVGKHLLGAIKQVLGDAATPELIDAWAEAYGILADALIAEEQKLYISSDKAAGALMRMRIIEIVQQSPSVNSYKLVPADTSVIPSFVPGQYVSVAVTLPHGQRQLRQYSLSDAPGKPYLQITVKREDADTEKPAGQVSNWLHQNKKVGDELEVSAPFGDFNVAVTNDKPVVILTAGVGITPMISALNHAVEINPLQEVHFLYAMRSPEHFLHKHDIDIAKQKMPNLAAQTFFEYVDDSGEESSNGLMNLINIPAQIVKEANFYICGPLGFMQQQRQALLAKGVSPTQIHREVFGPDLLDHLV